jgi:hypothetical protein
LSALIANYDRLCTLFPYIRAACRRESYLAAVGDFARRWAALRGCDSPNPVPTITLTPAPSTDSIFTSGNRNTAPCPSSTTDDADPPFAAAFASAAEYRRRPAVNLPRSTRPLATIRLQASDGDFKFENNDLDDLDHLDGSEAAAAGDPWPAADPGWQSSPPRAYPDLSRFDYGFDSSRSRMSAARPFPVGWGRVSWSDSGRLGPVDSDGDIAPPAWLGSLGDASHLVVVGGGGAGCGLGSGGGTIGGAADWALPAGSGLFAPPPLMRQAAATFSPPALAAALIVGQSVDRRPLGPAGPPPPPAAACFSHSSAS